MKRKIFKRLAALICAASLLLTAAPAVCAEQSGPQLTVSSVSTNPGGTCSVSVLGSNFSNMTALEFWVTYDTNALSVSGATARGMDYATANTATDGFVRYSGISNNGKSGNNTLLTLTFQVAPEAELRDYSLSLLVTEATALVDGADVPVSVAAQPGTLTVKERETPKVSLYGSLSPASVTAGDTLAWTIRTYSPQNLAGGQFVFLYDSNLFEYEGLELLDAMTRAEHVYSVNAANAGQVIMSYAAQEAVSSGQLMKLTLRAKESASGTTQLELSPNSLLDVNEAPLAFSTLRTDVTLKPKEETPVLPKVWVEIPEELRTDQNFTAKFWVEACSGLAAGDFSLTYDPSLLECRSVFTQQEAKTGGYVVINDDYTGGTISFSALYAAGVTQDTCLISAEFKAAENQETSFVLTPAAKSIPVDKNVAAIELDYVPASGRIVVPGFEVRFLDWDGTEISVQNVSYLAAAQEPQAPSRPFTDTSHYTFVGWDGDFSAVEREMEIRAQYEEMAHDMGQWAPLDEHRHGKGCSCGYEIAQAHEYGGWSDKDEETHERSCPLCSGEQTQRHTYVNGSCTVCGKDASVVVVDGARIYVSVPDLDGQARLITAMYTQDGMMLECYVGQLGESAQECETGDPERAYEVRVFVVDSEFSPLRDPIIVTLN